MQSIINASPGCYADDDGSSDTSERYNFYAHGKRFLFAPCSLGIFDESSKLRQYVVWIVTSKLFDRIVLLLIATNSIMLAIVDVRHVDDEGNPASEGSLRNTMADYSNSIFTALFTFECMLKVVAMGLIGDRGAYLMDPWNWIDFTVVVVGLVAALPSVPAVAGVRALLVLRPLRFFNAVPALILLNTVLLSLDQYPADEDLASIVDVINFVLTQIFLLEAVLKMFGLGFQQWAEDRYNLFDALVVMMGIVEAIVSPPQFLSGSTHAKSQSFAGLRSMRIFRLFKLARSWPSLQKLLHLIANAVSEIGNFSVFLLLFMYVYALLAAAGINDDEYVPRANFDSLLWSGVTVFQDCLQWFISFR
ncbi:hypothetical protein KRP22_010568 [Phytophthora ramorum]|nr:Sodium channel protein type 3 subunit alpha [Phytophthora ramorum]